MKLYIYEHCPFSARVRFVAGMLNLATDIVVIDYDDDQTITDIIGRKQVPVLVTGDGEVIVESLDIISHLLNLADSIETSVPSAIVVEWQHAAFLPLQKIGYPRWSSMGLQEFNTDAAKKAWRDKKETDVLNFDSLLTETPVIAKQVETLICSACNVLNLNSDKSVKLVDQAIVFSILRGFFSAPEINWEPSVKKWMESVSTTTIIKLLK